MQTQNNSGEQVTENSNPIVAHILAFKEKMEYYKEHPGLKDGSDTYTADSAVWEMEALLNFNFCYTDITCNKKSFNRSQVNMQLDENDEITSSDLSDVYYVIIDTIKAQMNRLDYDSIKLLLVDLKLDTIYGNGNAVINVGSLVGNERNISVTTDETGWWFGKSMGNCQLQNAPLDATAVLTNDIYFYYLPAPPPGKVRRKSTIVTVPDENLFPDGYEPWDYFLVPEADRDNFEDSRLFYASKNYGTITDDTRCVSGYNENPSEMTFYLDSYQQFIDDAENENNFDFTDCVIKWHEQLDNSNNQEKIWHTLKITLGHVWLVDEDEIDIQDIQTY